MASAVVFCPRPELNQTENLHGFIESARNDLHVFGEDLPFDDNVWDVTDFVGLKGRGNKKVRINFYAFGEQHSETQVPLREPFLSFSKAYIRYMHGLRPKKFANARLYALKALALALEREQRTAEIEALNGQTFDTAARLLQDRYSEELVYRVGKDLEQIGEFLTESRLTTLPIHWKSFIRRPSGTDRVGEEFDERRAAKLPSDSALAALPLIFQQATTPADVLATSITAILLSAPSRINEVLLMVESCEVLRSVDGKSEYGLRWWPSKGAEPFIKPVFSGMADVVRMAIAKIRAVTAPARQIARWYEENPTKIFLPPELEHLRTADWLSASEIAQITGVQDGVPWCRTHRIETKNTGHGLLVRFADFERAILSMLPQGFPILNCDTDLRYSDALILVRKNELGAQRSTYLCMIEPVPTDWINVALGPSDQRESVFSRFGFKEPDGSRIKVTTHQFRHYLNTVAQLGGLSQLEIAKWSGRVDVSQNEAYNHVTSDEMLFKIRNAVGDESQMFGPLGVAPDRRLISRDEFAQLVIPTAHVNELGFCIHDYTMTPCEVR